MMVAVALDGILVAHDPRGAIDMDMHEVAIDRDDSLVTCTIEHEDVILARPFECDRHDLVTVQVIALARPLQPGLVFVVPDGEDRAHQFLHPPMAA